MEPQVGNNKHICWWGLVCFLLAFQYCDKNTDMLKYGVIKSVVKGFLLTTYFIAMTDNQTNNSMCLLDELFMKAILKWFLLQSGGNATQIQSLSLTCRQLAAAEPLCCCWEARQSWHGSLCWLNNVGARDLCLPIYDVILYLLRMHTHTHTHTHTHYCVLLWHLRKFDSTLIWHFKGTVSTSLPEFIHTISWMAKEPSNDYILIRHLWDSQPALKSLPPEMNGIRTCFHYPH